MIGVLAFLLLVVLLAPLLFGREKRMLLGINIYCTINAILIVPGLLALHARPEALHADIYMSVPTDVPAFAWTIAMIALLNVGVYTAYFAVGRRKIPAATAAPIDLLPYETTFAVGLLVMLSFAIFLQKLAAFGGLSAMSDTVQDRVALQAGFGPANFLASAAAVLAMIIAVRRALVLRTPAGFAVLAAVALICAAMFSLFGGRKESIQLAAMTLAVISLYSPRFMRLGLKTLLALAGAYAVMFLYFVAIFIYRNWSGGDLSVAALADRVVEAFDGYQQFLILLSYSDTYLFVTNFFDQANYYLGSTFADLFTAFVPSGLMPDKPPVDDGVFVRAATAGYLLEPGTPAHLITHNSFPPETLGTAYMNGGPWLVAPFGLLLGAVFGKTSQLIARHPNSPMAIALYLSVFLNFEISNLRITQLIAQMAFTAALIGVLRLLSGLRRAPAPAGLVGA